MDNCREYMELISAYADGELPETGKQRLDEHLRDCENCTALLELYSEMSSAVTGSCEPSPEALREGVMKEILRESAATTADNIKRRRIVRVIMSRYVPIAACLAIILLVLPRFLSANRTGSGSMPAGESSVPGSSVQMSGTADTAAGGAMSSPAAGGGFGSDEGGAIPPAAAPAPSPSNNSAAAPEYAYNTAAESDEQPADALFDEESALAPEINDEPEDDRQSAETPEETPQGESGNAPEDAPAPLVPPSIIDGDWPDNWQDNLPDNWQDNLPDDWQDRIPENWPDNWPDSWPEQGSAAGGSLFTEAIYAIIQINGGLPELMAMYGLDPIDDVAMYYEIPREYADMLIEFVRDLDGVTVTIVDENGGYAVLIYTPAE